MTTQNGGHAVQNRLGIPEGGPALDSIFSGLAVDGQSGETAELRVQIITQAGVPRWVLPRNTRRVMAVLRSWRPYSAKSRLQWNAIVASCQLNALAVLPGVTRETMHCDLSYWRRRLPGFADSWSIVSYIGGPSPTRKALLFFVDDKHVVRAVTKVPLSPAARPAILNEVTILTKLQHRLLLPRVLFSDEREGIAAQSWMGGSNVSRSFGTEHLDLLTSLASESAYVRLGDYRDQLEKQIASLQPPVDLSLLKRALSFLEIQGKLRACVEHGDFAPWNMRRLADGRVALIDWEWASEEGLPWQDVCRYFYLQDFLFHESAKVWKLLTSNPLVEEYRRRFELSREAVRGLTIRYLLRYLCQECSEGNRDRVEYAMRKIREVMID